MTETAVYIHIPFCEHKCIYCDFYSVTVKNKTETYLESLKKEIEYYSGIYSKEREIISIYFGGGTPSLMEPSYIGEIIESVKKNFHVSPEAEITLETNPGTVNKKKMEAFRAAGINRVSIGVQSFSDKDLKFLTRIHDSAAAERTVFYTLDAGIENISVDLIFNLPNQSKEKWTKNLEKAIALPVKHISAYSLIVEPGTVLNKLVNNKNVKIQDAEIDADLYEYTIDFLERHGFAQYEVSNFSKPGFESVHNNAYWRYKDYLSFGASAHSFAEGKRWWNFTGLTFYLNEIAGKGCAVAGSEILADEQTLQEYVMLSLRSSGIKLREFTELFGQNWIFENEKKLVDFFNHGLINIDNERIKLTKKGYTLCDEILTMLK